MKAQTKNVVGGILLALCAGIIGMQAWRVGYIWLDMFYFGPSVLVSPWWLMERALITLFAFYPTIVILRLLQQKPIWVICSIGFGTLGLCFTRLFIQPLWGLPTFVGIHLVAVAFVVLRYIGALRRDRSVDAAPTFSV